MRLKFVLGAVLVLVLHAVCSQGQFEPSNNNNLDVVANSVTNLAQKISRAIASSKSKTEIFSPVSIAGALSLLLLGSSGVTRDELTKLMGFDSQPINFAEIHKSFGKLFRELVSPEPSLYTPVSWRQNDKCNNYDYEDDEPSPPPKTNQRGKRDTSNPLEVDIGNAIFAQRGQQFGERYEKLAQQLYQTYLKHVDFAHEPQKATSTINQWVREQTRGKIPEIVSQLNTDTLMVIANTLFFKAEWEEPFLKDGTKIKPFYPNGPNQAYRNVTTMVHGGCFPYYYWKEQDTKVLGIPYKKNNTMYVFLPNDSDRSKLTRLQPYLTANKINEIISKMDVKTVSVQFPKMHLINSFNLKQVLEQLGVYRVFDHSNTDLYRILPGYERFQGSESEDIFDLLSDTVENAVSDLQHEYPNCSPYEKDVDTKTTCEKSKLCRYGGSTCMCCPKTFETARKRRATDDKPQPQPLYVNEIVHKVDVVVNEKGTEGGAVTATLLDRITAQANFRANGPFLVMVRDENTKLPLFYGNVFDPSV